MDRLFNNIETYSKFDKNSDSQKIGIFVVKNQTYQPPTYIRLLSVFNHLNSKFDFCLIDVKNESDMRMIKSDLLNDNFLLDIIIFSREAFHSDEFLELLLKKCKLLDIKIIYELDDDLINIDKTHRDYEYYALKKKGIYRIVKNANVVTVSTNALKSKLQKYNDNIVLIPNVITHYWDCDVDKLPIKNDNVIKVGYMGTPTHKDDIKILEDTINIVKKHFKDTNSKNIVFEMIGGTAEELSWANQIEVSVNNKFFPNFVKFVKENVNWDVAVAPLEDNNINASKSELKYLEYSYLGIPAVYSAVGPYIEKIKHGYNGLLVYSNTPEEWAKNIINLIENKKLRDKIILNSKNDVNDNHNLNISIKMWSSILEKNSRDRKSIIYKLFKSYKKDNQNSSFVDYINENSYKIIKDSNLFDEEYYFSNYPDVLLSGMDPIKHYLTFGVDENCNPNYQFNTMNYIINYPFVNENNLNPFVHSLLYGLESLDISTNSLNKLEKKYKVSIIMPTFNRRNIISRSINSVINQSFKNFELLIIDDGSSDNTCEFIKERYGKFLDSGKIKYFELNHGGVSVARNFGLKQSKGNIIAYLDSDNQWVHNFLEKMIFELDNNDFNCGYCAVKVYHLNNDSYVLNSEFNRKNLLKQNFIDINSFMHKRELYEEKGGFDEKLTRLVDWDLIIRYTENNDPYFVNKILVNYFISSDLNNITLTEPLERNMNRIRAKYWPELYDEEYNTIVDFFDQEYYLEEYPDVLRSNIHPIYHFLSQGYKEMRNPTAEFKTSKYYEDHPELIKEDINPFVHYINSNMQNKSNKYSKEKDKIINNNKIFLSNYSFEKIKPLVSIIILNKNGLNHLKILFKDFARKTNYSNFEIIVVDNASTDSSIEFLENFHELPIKILKNKENVSFSKGNNDAVKMAKGEYILLLNNDIEPTYGWLNEMMGTMIYNDNVGAVGAKLLYPFIKDKTKQKFSFSIQHAGDIFIEKIKPDCEYGALNRNKFSKNIFTKSLIGNKKCLLVTGAVLLIKKEVYLELGGLDEDYWYGYEDIDFNLRLYEKGYNVILSNSALLFHHESATPRESTVLPYNARLLCKKWNKFLFKKLLKDKIENNRFFTDKPFEILLVANHNFNEDNILKKHIQDVSTFFINKNYETTFISDLSDFEIGGSVDVLISFTKDYDTTKIYARKNIIKILIIKDYFEDYNYNKWDIIIVNTLELKNKLGNNTDVMIYFVDDLSKLGENILSSLYIAFL